MNIQPRAITGCIFPQVRRLKERIEEERGREGFPVAGLRLIYAGMLRALVPPNILTYVLFGLLKGDQSTKTPTPYFPIF